MSSRRLLIVHLSDMWPHVPGSESSMPRVPWRATSLSRKPPTTLPHLGREHKRANDRNHEGTERVESGYALYLSRTQYLQELPKRSCALCSSSQRAPGEVVNTDASFGRRGHGVLWCASHDPPGLQSFSSSSYTMTTGVCIAASILFPSLLTRCEADHRQKWLLQPGSVHNVLDVVVARA